MSRDESHKGKGKSGGRKAPAPFHASAARPHHDEAAATEIARNAFSRERYEFLLRVLFVTFGVLALSVVANVFFGMRPVQVRYFTTDPEGGIREVIPLERPIQTTNEVLNWATDSVVRSFTLNFANYQSQLNEHRLLFTDSGWKSYQNALERSKVLATIIKEQLASTAVPQGAPVIVSQGIVEGGRYGWRIELPLLLTYENVSGRNSEPRVVELVVVRRPEVENPRGLGIAQIFAR